MTVVVGETTRRSAAGALVILTLLLAGCATPEGGDAPAAASEEPGSTTAPPGGSPAGGQAGEAQFGRAYTWRDGLRVAISEPTTYRPGTHWSAGKREKHFVLVTVTVTNATKERFDPGLLYVTATTGGREASDILDDTVGQTPNAVLPPGRTRSFKLGFGVMPGKAFVARVEVLGDAGRRDRETVSFRR